MTTVAINKDHHRRAMDALVAVDGDISKLDTRDFITLIHSDLQEIRQLQQQQAAILSAVKEILEAWDDAKGFIRIVKIIGNTTKWAVAVGVSIAAVWYAIRTGGGTK